MEGAVCLLEDDTRLGVDLSPFHQQLPLDLFPMKSVLLEVLLDVLVGFLEADHHGEHEDAKPTVARREMQRQNDN